MNEIIRNGIRDVANATIDSAIIAAEDAAEFTDTDDLPEDEKQYKLSSTQFEEDLAKYVGYVLEQSKGIPLSAKELYNSALNCYNGTVPRNYHPPAIVQRMVKILRRRGLLVYHKRGMYWIAGEQEDVDYLFNRFITHLRGMSRTLNGMMDDNQKQILLQELDNIKAEIENDVLV